MFSYGAYLFVFIPYLSLAIVCDLASAHLFIDPLIRLYLLIRLLSITHNLLLLFMVVSFHLISV